MAIDFENIIKKFEAAQKESNQANLLRYNQLIEAIQALGARTSGTYSDILSSLDTMGTSEKTRIQDQMVNLLSQTEQDLISRGLGNTTIRASAKRGVVSDTQKALTQLAESVAGQKAGIKQNQASADFGVTQMLAGAIEGRNDVGPDLGMYASLLQQAAAAGTGQPITASVGRGLPSGYGSTSMSGGSFGPGSGSGNVGGSGGSSSGASVVTGGSANDRIITNPDATSPTSAPTMTGGSAYLGKQGSVTQGDPTQEGLINGKPLSWWEWAYKRGAGLIGEHADTWKKAKEILGK